jgi:hypothetical protein
LQGLYVDTEDFQVSFVFLVPKAFQAFLELFGRGAGPGNFDVFYAIRQMLRDLFREPSFMDFIGCDNEQRRKLVLFIKDAGRIDNNLGFAGAVIAQQGKIFFVPGCYKSFSLMFPGLRLKLVFSIFLAVR